MKPVHEAEGAGKEFSDEEASSNDFGSTETMEMKNGSLHRLNSFDTLYFKPKKKFYMSQEDTPSRSTLVRVNSDGEKRSFGRKSGTKINEEFKYRAFQRTIDENSQYDESLPLIIDCGHKRRFQMDQIEKFGRKSQLEEEECGNEINDEIIPGIDFRNLSNQWDDLEQSKANSFKNSLISHFHDDALKNQNTDISFKLPLSRYSSWSTDDNITSSDMESQRDRSNFTSSHAQVAPIPFPTTDSRPESILTPAMLARKVGTGKSFESEKSSESILKYSNDQSSTNIEEIQSFFFAMGKRRRSIPDSYDSISSSLSLAPTSTISLLSDLDMTLEKVSDLIRKLPTNFLSSPYTQRKKALMELVPDKNYKKLMLLIKKYMLTTSKSNISLHRSSTNKSTHNSMASQFLNSFSPTMLSEPSSIGFKSNDKGVQVLGHSLGKIVGFGACGMIRESFDVKTGQCHAVKIVKFKNNKMAKSQVMKEISIWSELKHKNILPLISWKLVENYAVYCLTDIVKEGSLYDLVISWGNYADSKVDLKSRRKIILTLSLQIISALNYMHSKNFAHGDVKLENCLVKKLGADVCEWKVLLCDFGMSTVIESSNIKNSNLKHADQDFHNRQKFGNENSFSSSNKEASGNTEKTKPVSLLQDDSAKFKPSKIINVESQRQNKKRNKISKVDKFEMPKGISSIPRSYDPSLSTSNFTNSSSHSLYTLLTPMEDKAISSTKDSTFNKNEQINSGTHQHTNIGSLPYAAPELLENESLSPSPLTDIWALGVLTYTMLVGKLPFKHDYESRLKAIILAGNYDSASLYNACECSDYEQKSNSKPFPSTETMGQNRIFDAITGSLCLDMDARWNLNMIETALIAEIKKV